MNGPQEKVKIVWSVAQSAKAVSTLSLAPSANARNPLPLILTVFIAMKSPPTTTRTTVLYGRFAVGVLPSTMRTMSAPPPTSPALRSVALFLPGTLVPLTTAPSHFKNIPMTCAARLQTTTTLTTWNCSSSSCVGATILGGASCYAPRPYFSFLWTAPFCYVIPITSP